MPRASWLSRFSTLSLGEELLLRPVQEDDAPQLAALVQRSRAHLTPFLGDLLERVYDEPTARAHLRAGHAAAQPQMRSRRRDPHACALARSNERCVQGQ